MTATELDDLTLAADFPAATREQWQRLVGKVLGLTDEHQGAPEAELATHLADGIDLAPLYVAADLPGDSGFPGQEPFLRGASAAGHRAGWDVRQRHEHPDPVEAREQIMEDLEGGVSSIWLGLGEGRTPIAALPDVLADVFVDLAAIVLDAGGETTAAADVFLPEVLRRGFDTSTLSAGLGADPIGVLARTGTDADLDGAVRLATRCAADFPAVRAITVDALPVHEAGGSDVQELAAMLGAGVDYLRALNGAGLSGPTAFGQLEFRLAATADQFTTIAKMRAARRLWSRIAEQCGVDGGSAGQRQHAVSSWTMQTRRDPWNNILRATLAAFSAGVGGADAVTVRPFDAALGLPDTLARRVARNVHALLIEESHVARVTDPAGGSWYVENLSEQLAQHAWTQFQQWEGAGGVTSVLRSGRLADELADSRAVRRDALAHRHEVVTGVSEFPLVGETLLSRPSITAMSANAGLPRIRWAQWHEQLRDRADAHTARTGAPPTIPVTVLDAGRAATSRMEALVALLNPAGITASAATDGAPNNLVAAVVAGDDVTTDGVRESVGQLRATGAGTVVVSGPKDIVGEVGADEPITADLDALALYGRLLDALGVSA